MDDRAERDHLLGIYISDHLAGAVAGTRLAERLANAECDGPHGAALAALARDIEQDRQELLALAETLGIEQHRYKQALAWVAERVALLKLNGRLIRRSPLSSLTEVEALLLGVRGKLAGWETLRRVLPRGSADPIDLGRLITRATEQLEVLTRLHGEVAGSALGAPG